MGYGIPIYQFLDTNGDGTGTDTVIADYSGAAEEFYIQPPAGMIYVINRAIPHIEYGPSTSQDWEKFGASAALTNGVVLEKRTSADVVASTLTGSTPVKTFSGWTHFCYDAAFATDKSSSVVQTFRARWTFGKSGQPIILTNEEKLVARVNDNFSGTGVNVTDFRINVQGFKMPDNAANRSRL